MPERVLLVEDDRDLRAFLAEELEEAGYEVASFPTADAALVEVVRGAGADLVVTDLIMPGMRGHDLLAELRARRPELNVIIITAFGSIESAIEMMRGGAYDYLAKPFGTGELLMTVRRALEESRLRRELARLSQAGAAPPGFVGASRLMRELFGLLGRAASSTLPVLVTGETGTGKELVARAIHDASGRDSFVAINCAALPEHLLESELFGHEKGAFTGADREKIGLFQAADRGTLFLDEVGELPLALQPKLLRVLESGEIRRVGATRAQTVDVRVVAATHRDLETAVAEGRFREDLYWRINVLTLHVPALRERTADIPLLAEHFLARGRGAPGPSRPTRVSAEAMAVLVGYSWPGNVRELRNAIDRATVLARSGEIRAEDLPPRVRARGAVAALVASAAERSVPLHDVERAYILEVVRRSGGKRGLAANILGMDRKTLYRRLQEYGELDGEGE
jgi:DNA-binding NtrC family response regulator